MKKMKKVISVVLIASMVFPFTVLAKDDDDDKVKLHKIEFSEIKPLVETRNLTAEEAIDGVEDAEDTKQSGIALIDSAVNNLNSLSSILVLTDFVADPLATPTRDDILYALISAQKKSLEDQKDTLTGMDIEELELQRDMAVDTITSGLETLYITYNSLGRQLGLLKNQKELAEAQLGALKVQQSLGMVTEIMVTKTENEIRTLGNNILQMERTRQGLKEQLNLSLAYEFDEPLEIGEVPRVERPQIVHVNVDSDYDDAWEESYQVLLNEDEKSKKEDEVLRTFRHGFYTAYQTMRDKQDTLEFEQDKLSVAESEYKIAQLKHGLGMISDLQFRTESNKYLSQEITVELAEDAVFQAYNAYEWAKDGLIVSSSSSGSSSSAGSF